MAAVYFVQQAEAVRYHGALNSGATLPLLTRLDAQVAPAMPSGEAHAATCALLARHGHTSIRGFVEATTTPTTHRAKPTTLTDQAFLTALTGILTKTVVSEP